MNGWLYKYPALAGALTVIAMMGVAAFVAPPMFYVMGFWWRFWLP